MYLQALMMRLGEGMARLPGSFREKHVHYLKQCQNSDGGFSGREGGSDLYYTGFALRGLAVLEALEPEIADRSAAFLRQKLQESASVVDFFSLLYCSALVQIQGGPDILENSPVDWPDRVAATLETFRTSDGGYGKTPGAKAGSTYHSFLVALCYQLLSRPMPDCNGILNFLASRQREDGGYVEIGPMRRSGTNPTAAAVGVHQIIKGENFDPKDFVPVANFLANLISFEGGICANSKIPVADLLSTFTGSWTLDQLHALDMIELHGIRSYARSLAEAEGGFRGGIWDEKADVEYTFYGLGTLALLALHLED